MHNALSILGLGLLLGMRHATDADHVVAVSTIIAKQKKIKAAGLIGAIWGIGHTITIFIVGTAIIVFHVVIPPRLGLFFEFLVALALIILGVLNLTGFLKKITGKLSESFPHSHLHIHGDHPHVHVHTHPEAIVENPGKALRFETFLHKYGLYQLIRPLIVGLVHGLAGSAAIALLILGSITDPLIALIYLLIFGLGTIIGMMLITTLIGLPIIATTHKFAKIDKVVTTASGILSLAFGIYLAYQIGFRDNLFGANPQWDPH